MQLNTSGTIPANNPVGTGFLFAIADLNKNNAFTGIKVILYCPG